MDYTNKDIKSIVSQNIKRLIDSTHKTRQDICKDLGIKYTTFCDWINGNSSPKLEALESMSKYFGIEIGDFFIDFDNPGDIPSRLSEYAAHAVELDMNTLDYLSDDQVRELIKRGFRFKHKTLEEYIQECGGKLKAHSEFDYGNPVGGEIW